jgi:hypothetical protein
VALTAQNKVDIRRHLGVPFAGVPGSQYTTGLRTILTVGQLESYMNLLQTEEECTLTGFPFGVVRIWGNPAVGNTVSVTVNGRLVSYTVQEADLLAIQPLANIAGALATAVNLTPSLGVQAASGSISTADVAPAALPATGQVSLVNPTPFVLSASGVGLAAVVDPSSNGQTYPSPNFAFNAGVPPVYGYIPICNYLEGRIGQEDAFMSFDTADVVKFRKYPVQMREQLYKLWCKRLGVALSVGPNPAGTEGMGSGFGLIA